MPAVCAALSTLSRIEETLVTAKTNTAVLRARGAQRQPPRPAEKLSREAMIREAAYFRAERRGFAQGAELDDWLAAEAEIDQALTSPAQRAAPVSAPVSAPKARPAR
jgi:Protein of unknown function (DUF2934)